MVTKQYPEGMSKDDKRRLREKCASFAVDEGVFMYRGPKGKWCRVIIDPSEKGRIAASLHADVGGAHYGQNATIRKVMDRFWWKSVADDIWQYVRGCEVSDPCSCMVRLVSRQFQFQLGLL